MHIHTSPRPRRSWKRFLLAPALLALIGAPEVANAQEDGHRLHVAVLQTNNFVVGPGAMPSGFFRWESDTTWTHMGWKKSRHNGISFNPDQPSTMFLACGNGVFRTTDGGQSFKIVTSWDVTEVQDITVDSATPTTLHIVTAYGIWRSTDNGDTWSETNSQIPAMRRFAQTIHADYGQGGHVIAGGEHGILRTTDGGNTWAFVVSDVAIRDVQQSRSNPDLWLAGTEDKGVWISRDRGATWAAVTGAIASETIYTVSVDPNNAERMVAGGYQTGVYVSTNGGSSWTKNTAGLPNLNMHGMIIDMNGGGRIWAGTVGNGVFYSDNDARNWTYAGLKGSEIWDMEMIGGRQ